MKKRQTGFLVLGMILMLLFSGCKRSSIVYDSSETVLDSAEQAVSEAADTEQEAVEDETVRKAEGQAAFVCVYVCGEVLFPGVYELPEGARLVDAIEAAGGMTEAAADSYLNLAAYAADGQKIEVLSAEKARELEEEAEKQEKADRLVQGGLVNLNLATKEQLMTLTGIGEAKAEDILNYRETNGGFSNVEELMQIPGIKSGVFQKIKDQITV